jgi:DNA-binding IclR family transcriptional regulator
MGRDQTDRRSSMLERGVQVLQAFRPHGGTLSLATLVERTGLPKPTVHRIAEELWELGLLERQPVGYRLGLGLFELGELVPAKADLREIALPFMQDLYEAIHETVHLGIRDGLDVVYAEKIHGHGGVDVPSRVGGRLPLSSTAVGKALLAYADPSVLESLLSRPLRRLTAQSITDPAKLVEDLAEVRRTGFAHDNEEAASGVSCLAVPILLNGEARAALSLTWAANLTPATALAPALRAVSFALARSLARSPSSLPVSPKKEAHHRIARESI